MQGDLSRSAQQQTQLVRYQVRALDRILQQLSRRPVIDMREPPANGQVHLHRRAPSVGVSNPNTTTTDPAAPTRATLSPSDRPVTDQTISSPSSTIQRRATTDPSATVDTTTRQRDANGRFGSHGDSNNDDGFISKLTDSMSHVRLMPADTNGVDPTVDAVNELGRVLSPLGKVTGAVFGGIGRLFGRDGQQKIPQAQQQHNRDTLSKPCMRKEYGHFASKLDMGLTHALGLRINAQQPHHPHVHISLDIPKAQEILNQLRLFGGSCYRLIDAHKKHYYNLTGIKADTRITPVGFTTAIALAMPLVYWMDR